MKNKAAVKSFSIILYLVRWTLLVMPVALVTGSLVALFLYLLQLAIYTRWQYPWLIFLLPIAGVFIYYIYKIAGKNIEAGNNLIIEEIHEPGGGVPLRMTPLVLTTTIITHLFGGSAGREGTAVQMGGSIAGFFARLLNLSEGDVKILLTAGIAAGFGAVFGTPVTGAIFALEVLAVGKVSYSALLPCLIASVIANITCTAWGIEHTVYRISDLTQPHYLLSLVPVDVALLLKVVAAAVLFGLTSYAFSWLLYQLKKQSNQLIPVKWMIPAIGGTIIILLTWGLGTQDYLSLGVSNPDPAATSIISCFHAGGADSFSWLWKLVFTVITIGTGFKGGEVTPLFFIGAALGNSIAMQTGAPVDLLAGLGFIAVFAGATNTPIACTIMGVELFGGTHIVYYAVACFTAYYFSGNSSIYSGQRNLGDKIWH